jgi:YrbI family 3-deoxy-D-manno-octulosonate 8-phosphate phosphatase
VDIDEWIHWRLAEERLGLELDAVKPGGAGISLLSSIRLIVFDFDGVFTDNRVYVDQNGHELVACNRSDGLGIERLVRHGIDAAVLSTESNPLVAARCRKLNLPVRQGLTDKAAALRDLVRSMRLTLDEVAYVGNDMNDLECLEIVRVAIVPADAYPSVRGVSDIVLHSRGGCGAVREVCELAIAAHSPEQEG